MGARTSSLFSYFGKSTPTSSDIQVLEFSDIAGRRMRCRTDLILPDGSLLNDWANEHLLTTIGSVLEQESIIRKETSGLAGIFGSLRLLVQWMFLKGVYRFEHLTQSHIVEFLVEVEQGLDVLIRATPRLIEYLQAASLKDPVGLGSKSVKKLLESSGIPQIYSSKLKTTVEVAEFFKLNGRVPSKNELHSSSVKKITAATLYGRVKAIELLWVHRTELVDPLAFNPFPEGAWLAVRSHGKPNGRTKTIPIELIPKLLGAAIEWVTVIGPTLTEIVNARSRTKFEIKEYPTSALNLIDSLNAAYKDIWPKKITTKIKAGQPEISVRTAKVYLLTACLIIIHSFTARRDVEIAGLRTDSLVGEEHNRYLRMDIAKIGLKGEQIPCPELVAIAIKTVIQLRGLDVNYAGSLWELNAKGNHGLNRNLDPFGEFVSAIQYGLEGVIEDWHYAVHQFRRIFAVLYVWRFEGPLAAIQHHLRHVKWKETMGYIRELDMYNEVLDQHIALTTSKLRSIASGAMQKPAGVQSAVLLRQIDQLRKSTEITDEIGLEFKLKSHIKDRGLTLRPTPWGYCGAKSVASNMRRAACQKESNPARAIDTVFNAPDGSGSSEEICAGCYFHLSDESREEHWRSELNKVIRMLELSDPSDLISKPLESKKTKLSAFIKKYYD